MFNFFCNYFLKEKTNWSIFNIITGGIRDWDTLFGIIIFQNKLNESDEAFFN